MHVRLWRQTFATLPFANAHQRWTARDSVLIQLTCPATGVRGVGEASPLPGFSRESADEVVGALRSVDTADWQFAPHSGLDLLRDSVAHFAHLPPAARFCLESALLDGVSRAREQSIEGVIHELAQELSQPGFDGLEPPRPAQLLDIYAKDVLERATASAHTQGAVFKVKVGRDLGFETEQLMILQRHLDARKMPFTLRLDANQSLTTSELRSAVEQWRSLPLEYLEEPCAPQVLATLDPATPLGVALAFDESLMFGLEFIAPWLPQVKALVCKPMYLGGVMSTLQWAKVASSRGIALVLSHLLDGPVSMRIYQALAKVLAPATVSGLGPHPGLSMWREHLVPRPSAFGSAFDVVDSPDRIGSL